MLAFGGQQLTVHAAQIDLELADDTERYRWMAQVGFVDFPDPPHEIAVAGHGGFFEFFTARFDSTERALSVTPASRCILRSSLVRS